MRLEAREATQRFQPGHEELFDLTWSAVEKPYACMNLLLEGCRLEGEVAAGSWRGDVDRCKLDRVAPSKSWFNTFLAHPGRNLH